MKFFIRIACVLLVIAFDSAPLTAAEKSFHYFDTVGNSLEKFEPVWNKLKSNFGKNMPDRIVVQITGGKYSRFNTAETSIQINESHYRTSAAKMVAHESVHLALHRMTNGLTWQNSFRFLDEGYASVFASRLVHEETEFRQKTLELAVRQLLKGNISFPLVQDWKTYWGNPRDEKGYVTNYAYSVGASFVYFLEEKYTPASVLRLLQQLGETGDLDVAARGVFHKSLSDIEKEWMTFLRDFKTEPN
jgi:hypothetical protein